MVDCQVKLKGRHALFEMLSKEGNSVEITYPLRRPLLCEMSTMVGILDKLGMIKTSREMLDEWGLTFTQETTRGGRS